MQKELAKVLEAASKAVAGAEDKDALEDLRVRYLGRKGELTGLLRSTGSLPPEERASFGQAANAAKKELEAALVSRLESLAAGKAAPADQLDVTLPGRRGFLGRAHPIMETMDEVVEIFGRLGYEVRVGPEIEDDYHNFEALNFPHGSSGPGHAGHFLLLRKDPA